MRAFPPNLNRSPAAWNLPTLNINANQITAAVLSAITAQIGNLVINNTGSLSSGETAYGVGRGFWLDGKPRFSLQDANGNYINIDASGGNVLGISSSGISGALTSKQVDDLGWRNTGIWNQVSGTPTTRAGYGIIDAQGTLPNATALGQVLQRDNGGSPYFAKKYGPEMGFGFTGSAPQNFTSATLVQWGPTLGFPNPGVPVNILCIVQGQGTGNAAGLIANIRLQMSIDGGTTWVDQDDTSYQVPNSAIATATIILTAGGSITNVTATGDIQFRVMVSNTGAANTITLGDQRIFAVLLPNAGAYSLAGALAASIPSTGTGSCTATYPTTTCTAPSNVTVNPSGGTPPYTYSWSVVSGTGTITAGSTSQTCTVSDTETATAGGATFNTVVKCTVTDHVPNNVTTGNDTITNTFTLVYSAITATVSTTNGSCSNSTCGTNCTANGSATANPSGGNGSYTYSWSVFSGTGTITGGATSQTVSIHDTQPTSQPNPWTVSNTVMQCSVNDTRGTGAVTPQGTVKLVFKCPTV